MSSWAVAVTVKSNPTYIDYFIKYYKNIGANEIFIFFDEPSQYQEYLKRGIEKEMMEEGRLVLISCDSEYWAKGSGRRRAIEVRQSRNCMYAYERFISEWMLNVDIDEYLQFDGRVSTLLSTVEDDCLFFVIRPYESIFLSPPKDISHIFDSQYFKSPIDDSIECSQYWKRRYGELARFMQIGGFWAHRKGKMFLRNSEVVRNNLEAYPLHYFGEGILQAHLPTQTGIDRAFKLLHFDAFTFSDWQAKHINRVNGSSYARAMGKERKAMAQYLNDILSDRGEDALFEIYQKMYVVGQKDIELLLEKKYVIELKEPVSLIANVDLSKV